MGASLAAAPSLLAVNSSQEGVKEKVDKYTKLHESGALVPLRAGLGCFLLRLSRACCARRM